MPSLCWEIPISRNYQISVQFMVLRRLLDSECDMRQPALTYAWPMCSGWRQSCQTIDTRAGHVATLALCCSKHVPHPLRHEAGLRSHSQELHCPQHGACVHWEHYLCSILPGWRLCIVLWCVLHPLNHLTKHLTVVYVYTTLKMLPCPNVSKVGVAMNSLCTYCILGKHGLHERGCDLKDPSLLPSIIALAEQDLLFDPCP